VGYPPFHPMVKKVLTALERQREREDSYTTA
jgi:hypothetical protein